MINIIGIGQRGVGYIKYIKKCFDVGIINGIYDNDIKKLKYIYDKYKLKCNIYKNLQELLDDDVKTIFICTPDDTHLNISKMCIKKSKNILIEKPICLRYDELSVLTSLKQKYKTNIYIPLVLQYTDLYNLVKNDMNKLGFIKKIHLNLMLSKSHSASYHRRWHRFKKKSGGFMNSKCCHDLALLFWLVDMKPINISSYRTNFDKPVIKEKRCKNCSIDCDYRFDGKYVVDIEDQINDLCIFNSGSELLDNQVVTMEFANGMIIIFDINLYCEFGDRSLTIYGEKGVIKSHLKKNSYSLKLNGCDKINYKIHNKGVGHNGAEIHFLRQIFEHPDKDILYKDGCHALKISNQIDDLFSNNLSTPCSK